MNGSKQNPLKGNRALIFELMFMGEELNGATGRDYRRREV